MELGVPACILADRLRFVFHYKIMWEGTDVDQSVPLVEEAREKYSDLSAVSFDHGFHSPDNRKHIEELFDCAAFPQKGRLSEDDKARERGP